MVKRIGDNINRNKSEQNKPAEIDGGKISGMMDGSLDMTKQNSHEEYIAHQDQNRHQKRTNCSSKLNLKLKAREKNQNIMNMIQYLDVSQVSDAKVSQDLS